MKTCILTTNTYLNHDTGQGHPEKPDRVTIVIDHLKNHHIILAKKVKNTNEIIENRKTTDSIEEWLKIRKNALD